MPKLHYIVCVCVCVCVCDCVHVCVCVCIIKKYIYINWDSFHARLKTSTTRHRVKRKRIIKILQHTGNLFRKNLQFKS